MENLYTDKKSCFGCGACAAVCPSGAVSMEMDAEGFYYPRIEPSRCTGCGSCTAVCPAKSRLARAEGRFYAVRCSDEELLRHSTSGGAFSLLAQEVLDEGGIVCGACFDENFTVRHMLSRDIAPMRKSKYVQSELSDCYPAMEEALKAGQRVLFCGTPCQCHAVKRFLAGSDESLILASLVCRGVQSPGLWRDYAAWLSRSGPLQAYDFRDKRQKNDGHAVSYTTGGKETVVPAQDDKLTRMYYRGLTYRPSCYACPYCCPDNGFDFTLGDFWGIERIHPQLADGRGTSLVIARGPRAAEFIARMAQKAQVIPCERDAAAQPALAAPAGEHLLRKFLFRDYAKSDISYLLKKYSMGQ